MTTVVTWPLRDLILVKLRPQPEKIGSIIRVDRGEIAVWGDVIEVGPECRDIRTGMGVLVNPLAGHVIGDNILVPESSIMATE